MAGAVHPGSKLRVAFGLGSDIPVPKSGDERFELFDTLIPGLLVQIALLLAF